MKLTIVSPLSKRIEEIAWIEFNTPAGNFIIQEHHAPMVLSLSSGKDIVFRLESGKKETVEVAAGFASIARDSVTVLLNK